METTQKGRRLEAISKEGKRVVVQKLRSLIKSKDLMDRRSLLYELETADKSVIPVLNSMKARLNKANVRVCVVVASIERSQKSLKLLPNVKRIKIWKDEKWFGSYRFGKYSLILSKTTAILALAGPRTNHREIVNRSISKLRLKSSFVAGGGFYNDSVLFGFSGGYGWVDPEIWAKLDLQLKESGFRVDFDRIAEYPGSM